MKKSDFLAAVVALSVLAAATPVAALGINTSLNADVKTEANFNNKHDNKDNDDRDEIRTSTTTKTDVRMDSRWMHWVWNAGITGEVTAKSGDTLTVKGANGTVYSVDASDAKIRTASGEGTIASIAVGDKIWMQGTVNTTDVVALLIIDAKKAQPQPSSEDKKMGIAGTVTAKSDTTLTVIGRNGTIYTVKAATDAKIWKAKKETTTLSNVEVGDSIIAQGTLSGSTVTASRIYVVEIPETSAKGGIRGTVTAVSGNTVTLLGTGGTTYSVNISDADVKDYKNKDEDKADIDVGEMLTVQGDVNGSSIEADTVIEAKAGFFHRFGLFFKNMFGKKNN